MMGKHGRIPCLQKLPHDHLIDDHKQRERPSVRYMTTYWYLHTLLDSFHLRISYQEFLAVIVVFGIMDFNLVGEGFMMSISWNMGGRGGPVIALR